MNNETINKYKNKVLGKGATSHIKDHYVKDFVNEDILIGFISNLAEHTADLTKEGYKFLEEYYGLSYLANLIKKKYPNFEEQFGTDPVIEWLKIKGQFSLE